MFPKLNREAPFGTIMGLLATHPTARFEQGGRLFDALGDCVDVTPEERAEADRIAAEAAEMQAINAADAGAPVASDVPPAGLPTVDAAPVVETAPLPEVPVTTATETVVGSKRRQPPPAV